MKDVIEMTSFGRMTFFLGIQVQQKQKERYKFNILPWYPSTTFFFEIFVCQQNYAKEILKKFNMEECKPNATPMSQKYKFYRKYGA